MPPSIKLIATIKHKMHTLLTKTRQNIKFIKKETPIQNKHLDLIPFTTFHPFPLLPTELKIMIFTHALHEIPPRVLKLRYHAEFESHHGMNRIRFSTHSLPHFFLSFTQTSRAAMMLVYSSIPQPGLDRIIRFHPHDTVYMTMMPVFDLSGKKLNFHSFPILPNTAISTEGERKVDDNIATMLSGINVLAIPLGWLGLKLAEWEDDLTKSLFLAHFQNLKTLMLVGPDLHKHTTDEEGREKEVFLHDQTEWELAVHEYEVGDEGEDVRMIRARGDREDFLAKAELDLYRHERVLWSDFRVALMCSSYEEADLGVMCQKRRRKLRGVH